jgi:hypothetical protein
MATLRFIVAQYRRLLPRDVSWLPNFTNYLLKINQSRIQCHFCG